MIKTNDFIQKTMILVPFLPLIKMALNFPSLSFFIYTMVLCVPTLGHYGYSPGIFLNSVQKLHIINIGE